MEPSEQRRRSMDSPPSYSDQTPGSAGATNISSKYQDIISNSSLIQSGSPAVYQLRPKKEDIETLTRFTVGEKDLNKTNRTILLVGETGAGKSTLINALVNYAMGVKWEDDVWFQIVEEEKKKDQSESQTSDVIVYQIFGFEGKTLPYSLTIINTPGYGDTRGIEQDDLISERLLDWFCSDCGVHEISAVGLVLKASVNRLSDRLRYIFDSVVSLFGKNMEKNIVALVTHSDGLTTENVLTALEAANIQRAKDEDNEPLHFMFNNHQNKQKTKKNIFALKHAWDLTTEGLDQFTDFLKITEPKSLGTTTKVLKSRIRLKACIQNLRERIELIELKQTEIQQTEEALKKHEEEKNYEKYEKRKSDFESLLENLQQKTEDLQREKHQLLDESFQLVVSLQQIALKADSLSTLVHLDFLIEKMKEKGDTEKIHKLEEMKSQMEKDQGVMDALRYGFGKLTAAGQAVKGAFMKK